MIEKRLMEKVFVGLYNYWLSAPDFDSTSNLVILRVIPVFFGKLQHYLQSKGVTSISPLSHM